VSGGICTTVYHAGNEQVLRTAGGGNEDNVVGDAGVPFLALFSEESLHVGFL